MLAEPSPTEEMPLDQVGVLYNFNPGDIAALKARLTRVAHPKGGVIFHQGDSGTDLFIVTRGTASAFIHQPTGRDIRLVTFAPRNRVWRARHPRCGPALGIDRR